MKSQRELSVVTQNRSMSSPSLALLYEVPPETARSLTRSEAQRFAKSSAVVRLFRALLLFLSSASIHPGVRRPSSSLLHDVA